MPTSVAITAGHVDLPALLIKEGSAPGTYRITSLSFFYHGKVLTFPVVALDALSRQREKGPYVVVHGSCAPPTPSSFGHFFYGSVLPQNDGLGQIGCFGPITSMEVEKRVPPQSYRWTPEEGLTSVAQGSPIPLPAG
ncbi:MAG: hypothetical protein GC129_03970 [Proteobacteria bacterium]|nr:hypothetical protein [Pseudomonadota bacterium]